MTGVSKCAWHANAQQVTHSLILTECTEPSIVSFVAYHFLLISEGRNYKLVDGLRLSCYYVFFLLTHIVLLNAATSK